MKLLFVQTIDGSVCPADLRCQAGKHHVSPPVSRPTLTFLEDPFEYKTTPSLRDRKSEQSRSTEFTHLS